MSNSKVDKESFFNAIDLVSKNNLIDKEEIFEIIKNSIIKIFQTKYDPDADLEVIIEPENGIFSLTNKSVFVVEDQDFDQKSNMIEIPLTEARKENPDVKVGDLVSKQISFESFLNPIKQLLIQTLRERKKENIYDQFKDITGTFVRAIITTITKNGDVILKLVGNEQISCFMPRAMRNLKIPFSIGQEVEVFVAEVKKESRDSQIIVSNNAKEIVKEIIKEQVPEVQEGIVEIVEISRIAGERSKVAVKSNNENVDSIGTIIGTNGSRIGAISDKLNGEKIDLIVWSDNLNTFVANSLEPAKVISIVNKKDSEGNDSPNEKIIVTPNNHKTLAIGKKGFNVRLAVELTKVNLDIISENEAKEQNIPILWNGNLKEGQEVDQNQFNKNKSNNYYSNNKFNPRNPLIDFDEISQDIKEFNDNIIDEKNLSKSLVDKDTSIDQSLIDDQDEKYFSDEELKQMEKDFGLDFNNEFSDFSDSDDENDESEYDDLEDLD